MKGPIKDGEYIIDGNLLGKGAFGEVYRAMKTSDGRLCAIKVLPIKGLDKNTLKSIEMEIDLLKRLHHSNIVHYIDAFKDKKNLYISLEFVEAGSLESIVKKFGNLPEPLIARYVYQVLEGLIYLHKQGVVHRDIKGANILTTKDGIVKLADFGIAATTDGAAEQGDDPSEMLGTPYWMAPEVIEVQQATGASDIWSVGCTIIELITGDPPYFDLPPLPALFRIVQDPHPPLPPGLSPKLEDLLLKCFNKEPKLRATPERLLKHAFFAKVRADIKANNRVTEDQVQAQVEARKAAEQAAKASKVPKPKATLPLNIPAPLMTTTVPKEVDLSKFAESGSDDDWDASGSDDGGLDFSSVGGTASTSNATATSGAADDEDDEEDMFGDVQFGDLASKLQTRVESQFEESAFDSDVDEDFDFGESDADEDEIDFVSQMKETQSRKFRDLIKTLQFTTPSNTPNYAQKILGIITDLTTFFSEDENARAHIKTHRGIIPLIELIEGQNRRIILEVLKLLNLILTQEQEANEFEIHENFCLVGGIPSITKFSGPEYSLPLRLESSRFVSLLVTGIHVTRALPIPQKMELERRQGFLIQMFIASRGLPVIVNMLAGPYPQNKTIILLAVDCLSAVFQLQSQTPKSDFCRLFAKAGLLKRLVLTLGMINRDRQNKIIFPENPILPDESGRDLRAIMKSIISLFQLFSSMDPIVGGYLAQKNVLRGLLAILDEIEEEEEGYSLGILKIIKNISNQPTNLKEMETVGLIPKLVPILDRVVGEKITEIHNQVLHTLFNMCRVNRQRQEQASMVKGFIDYLQQFIKLDSPMKHLCLQMVCDLVRASPKARQMLAQAHGAEFYIEMLTTLRGGYQSQVLDAISAWVHEDPQALSPWMARPQNVEIICNTFSSTSKGLLHTIAESLLNMTESSDMIAQHWADSTLVGHVVDKFDMNDIFVMRTLLTLLLKLYEKSKNPKKLLDQYQLYSKVKQVQDVAKQNGIHILLQLCSLLLTAFAINTLV